MITIKDIETCEEKLMQAMKNCDLAIIGELLHDDLLFNAPNGETITKDIDMAAYRSGNMVVDDYSISDRQISLIDDTGIVAVSVEVKGSFMLQPIHGTFRYIRIWKYIDGAFKMIGGGCTPT